MSNMAKELGLEEEPKVKIHIDLQRMILKISNWKTPGHDGIHGFWFKKFTTIHSRLVLEINRGLQEVHVSEWMTKGRTILVKKKKKPENESLQTTTDL